MPPGRREGRRLPGVWLKEVADWVLQPGMSAGGEWGVGGVIQPAQALSLGTLQVMAVAASRGVPTHDPSFALVTELRSRSGGVTGWGTGNSRGRP